MDIKGAEIGAILTVDLKLGAISSFPMDKETLIRLATPASIFALAISIVTLPLTVKSYGHITEIKGEVNITTSKESSDWPLRVYLTDKPY